MTFAVKVKICGITTIEDAEMCAAAGADYLGLNFWPPSPRVIDADRAADLARAARAARPDIALVGVFVDQPAPFIEDLIATVGLDFVQLHGDETPEFCARFGDRAIKAVAIGSAADLAQITGAGTERVLIDSPSIGRGGSGLRIPPELAERAARLGPKVFVAGGLHPDNVREAMAAVPYAVDVASGVEHAPGKKDRDKVCRFIARVKGSPS